jgi:asparagine synthase (glutamine-hydrolysing)
MQQPAAIEMIHESRKKLVNKNILNPNALNAKMLALPAHAANNFDWRYISAAGIL